MSWAIYWEGRALQILIFPLAVQEGSHVGRRTSGQLRMAVEREDPVRVNGQRAWQWFVRQSGSGDGETWGAFGPEAVARDFSERGDASSGPSPRHVLREFMWLIPFILVHREVC